MMQIKPMATATAALLIMSAPALAQPADEVQLPSSPQPVQMNDSEIVPDPFTTSSILLTEEQKNHLSRALSSGGVRAPAMGDVLEQPSIGDLAPPTAILQPLPPSAGEIVPALEGFGYFVSSEGSFVIVDPQSRRIIGVVDRAA